MLSIDLVLNQFESPGSELTWNQVDTMALRGAVQRHVLTRWSLFWLSRIHVKLLDFRRQLLGCCFFSFLCFNSITTCHFFLSSSWNLDLKQLTYVFLRYQCFNCTFVLFKVTSEKDTLMYNISRRDLWFKFIWIAPWWRASSSSIRPGLLPASCEGQEGLEFHLLR
jgi:hypothetical protein